MTLTQQIITIGLCAGHHAHPVSALLGVPGRSGAGLCAVFGAGTAGGTVSVCCWFSGGGKGEIALIPGKVFAKGEQNEVFKNFSEF